MIAQVDYCCSSQIGEIMLDSLQEIIGLMDVKELVERIKTASTSGTNNERTAAFYFSDLGNIQTALDDLYGKQAGHGVAIRAGQISFNSIYRQFGEEMGFNALDYRLKPTNSRIYDGLHMLAAKLSTMCSFRILIEENEDAWVWKVKQVDESSMLQIGLLTLTHFMLGLLQEFLQWVTGGKYFNITELNPGTGEEIISGLRIDK